MKSNRRPKSSRSPHKKFKRPNTSAFPPPSHLQFLFDSDSSHSSDYESGSDDGDHPVLQSSPSSPQASNVITTKERKAASQRRYYQRNKAKEQEKARLRAAQKRMNINSCRPMSPMSPHMGGCDLGSMSPTPTSPMSTSPTPTSPTPTSPTPTSAPSQPPQPPPDDSPVSTTLAAMVPEDVRIEWPSWSARRRLLGLRRWLLDLEWQEGGVETWNSTLMTDWARRRRMVFDGMDAWLNQYQRKVLAGRLILRYLGRVMDGALLGDLEAECRDLALQVHQLGSPLYAAVVGLEVSLDWVQM